MSIIKYFTIDGEYITLGQFLKEESIISSGGQAKFYLQDNPVTLNGEEEKNCTLVITYWLMDKNMNFGRKINVS